jgi:hypothetical protein
MLDRLANPDGTFTTAARLALAAIVTAGLAVGYVARPSGNGTEAGRSASRVAQSRIEADVAARATASGPALAAAPELPGLAVPGRPARRALPVATATPQPEETAQPVDAPLETPTPTPTPAATAAPPPTAPPAAPPARPTPSPPSTTFDSSG